MYRQWHARRNRTDLLAKTAKKTLITEPLTPIFLLTGHQVVESVLLFVVIFCCTGKSVWFGTMGFQQLELVLQPSHLCLFVLQPLQVIRKVFDGDLCSPASHDLCHSLVDKEVLVLHVSEWERERRVLP